MSILFFKKILFVKILTNFPNTLKGKFKVLDQHFKGVILKCWCGGTKRKQNRFLCSVFLLYFFSRSGFVIGIIPHFFSLGGSGSHLYTANRHTLRSESLCRAGLTHSRGCSLFGSPSLFQCLYYSILGVKCQYFFKIF